MTNSTYDNANADGRTRQLRTAKVEESQIAELAKKSFDSLPQDVQSKINNSA